MRLTNRDSYAAAVERLLEVAAELSAEDLVELAEQVMSFARVLVAHPRLRRALAAQSRPAADRVELLRNLFDERLAAGPLTLAETVVAGHWTVPGDLLNAVERLAVEALLISGDRAGELAAVEDQLFRFGRIVTGDPRLEAAMEDVTVRPEQRFTLASDLLGGKVLALTRRLVEISLHGFGGREFAGSLIKLVELVAEHRARTIAYVTTAQPLDRDQETRLAAALAAQYGQRISLKTEIDPGVLGGVLVRVGADLYDGTVRRRLATARASLTR